ncbi:MAG: glycoside hydrolase, partial [Lachnospiraceae bacterium]|nr:glycoside hydrolase [Lachnospiraceae bacterium]
VTDGEICAMKLSKDLTHAVEEPRTLLKASQAPWTTKLDRKDRPNDEIYVTDGPFLHTLADGRLDLVWSSFHNGDYAIGHCISEHGIAGPFRHVAEPIFQKDGGHGMVFRDKEGRLMLTIHMPNHTPDERPVFFELKETSEGLTKV